MRNRHVSMMLAALATVALSATSLSAQENPRFGVWKMKSDAPPPQSNIMTYAPWGDGGMSITVASVNRNGEENEWGYNTLFDSQFREVWGQNGGADTSVEVIDERSTRISNRRNGRVYQVIINTLSEDGNTIENEYVRLDEQGRIRSVGHATYERIR